jgi:hypothetical protein
VKQLPQHVSAVSPLGDALNGTGTASLPYSIPRGGGRQVTTAPSPNWFCRSKGCPRQFPRAETEGIAEHLRMHLASAGPRSSVPLTVTPELCERWLANTKLRRPLNEANWRRIEMSITEDGWVYDGNPFGLDTEENLVQGGHRARAIIAAGVDVESALTGGLPPEAALHMDTGKPQSFSDVLTAAGVSAGADLASVAVLLWRLDRGQLDPRVPWRQRIRPSNAQLLRLFQASEAELRAGLSAARSIAPVAKFASRSGLAVAYIAISRVAGDEAGEFFRALAMKESHASAHGEHDPVVAWHRKWGRQARNDKLHSQEQAALTIKCWNFYARGLPARRLVWYAFGPHAEAFPEPVKRSLASRDDDETGVRDEQPA